MASPAAAAAAASIPRFLLPRRNPLWQVATRNLHTNMAAVARRPASSSSTSSSTSSTSMAGSRPMRIGCPSQVRHASSKPKKPTAGKAKAGGAGAAGSKGTATPKFASPRGSSTPKAATPKAAPGVVSKVAPKAPSKPVTPKPTPATPKSTIPPKSTQSTTSSHPPPKSTTPSTPPPPPPPPPKPSNILEQPTKFNPPSHGSRLSKHGAGVRHTGPSGAAHYGGDLSAAEKAAQRLRDYPGLMAPRGTWSYWFWNSRLLHLTLTMTILFAVAGFTFIQNIRYNSPFADLLPERADLWRHPIQSVRRAVEVIRLTEQRRSEEIAAKRQQRVDDVAKRTMYRKAHGMDETVGFGSNGGWFGKKEGPDAPQRNEPVDDASPVAAETAAAATAAVAPEAESAKTDASVEAGNTEKRKKFLGIF